MAGCQKEIVQYVLTRYSYKEVSAYCGQTGINGYPLFCEDCEKKYEDVNWRKLALENGENWGDEEEDYFE